jgi:hypothetical protein
MKNLLLASTLLAAMGTTAAHAAVQFTQMSEDGDELKMYIDVAHTGTGTNDFFGSVGANTSAKDVEITTVFPKVTTGAGYATIKPASGNLVSILFTPTAGHNYDGFFTRGQLVWASSGKAPSTGAFHMQVNGSGPGSQGFTYSGVKLKADFESMGFDEKEGTPGGLISSVLLWADPGFAFKEVKQVDWSPCGTTSGDCGITINPTLGAPEPSTWAMGLIGFGMVGLIGWGKRNARPARFRLA